MSFTAENMRSRGPAEISRKGAKKGRKDAKDLCSFAKSLRLCVKSFLRFSAVNFLEH
jgi:hypothetical protein